VSFDMTRKQRHPSRPRYKLNELLKRAANHKMTPQEIWDQRVSFAYGQLMDCAPDVTREQVMGRATEMYGPRPIQDKGGL